MAVTFIMEERRWHGCRYDVVRPSTLYKLSHWQEMEAWCRESFDKPGDPWKASSSRWYVNGGKFWFRRPADLTAFMLRWA